MCGSMFGSRPFGGSGVWYVRARNRYAAFAAAPATPLPVRNVTVTVDGDGVFSFTLIPSAAAFAALDEVTSGFWKASTALWMSVEAAWQPRLHCTLSMRFWNRCPDGRPCAKSA